jgi:RNA polymerase sigma-70 factor (ECF subfamily)
MPSSPAPGPSQPEAIELHRRLVLLDPTASHDLVVAYLEPLVAWLSEINCKVPSDLRVEAAEDALLSLILNPNSYSPDRQTLEAYLRMSARGDLLNRVAKERKHHKNRIPWDLVELSPDAGKYLGRCDDSSLSVSLAEEDQIIANAIPENVKLQLSETDLRALMLILKMERSTTVFAELYGLQHLTLQAQTREVKRHKDRLKKILKRAGKKQ